MRGRFRELLALAAVLAATGCKASNGDPEPSAAPSGAASQAVAPSAKPLAYPAPPDSAIPPGVRARTKWPVPVGPALEILAGQGVGPIRIGATVATIERHMQSPCEIETKGVCRYIAHALEFLLDEDGVTTQIRIHASGRRTGDGERTYGVFNGRFRAGAQFGMYREAVAELIGKPKSLVHPPKAGEHNTVEVHFYDGMTLQYDRIPNGNVVLGGVILFEPGRKTDPATGLPI